MNPLSSAIETNKLIRLVRECAENMIERRDPEEMRAFIIAQLGDDAHQLMPPALIFIDPDTGHEN